MGRRLKTEYPEKFAILSRDHYHRRISTEDYRSVRRRLIDEMEQAFNQGSEPSAQAEASPRTANSNDL